MHISEEKIKEYKDIYKEEYGEGINDTQALDELTSLVCLMEAVSRHQNKD